MATSDDGVPQYYCFVCGTPIGVDSFIDRLRWSEVHGIGEKEYLPEHVTSWTTEFRLLVRYPQDRGDGSCGGGLKYRLLQRSQATPPLDEESGQVYWYQGMIVDPDIRQSYLLHYFEYETYRLYENNTNELDENGNPTRYGYPMHVNCHNQLQQFLDYTNTTQKHLGLLDLDKFWRMLSSLEDEEYGCKLGPRKQNLNHYGYGGAEEYSGWCRTWESWYPDRKRQSYNSLPLGWKYFVNPGLSIHNDDPSSKELDSTGLNLQAEEFGKRLKNVQRSDLANEIKVKLVREIHEEHRRICDIEISKLIARRLNPLIADARDWSNKIEPKPDLEILKEAMNSCFLDPEKTVPRNTEPPADDRSFEGSYMCRFPQEIVLQILNYLPTMAIIYALEGCLTSTQANSQASSTSTSILPDSLPATFWNSRFNNAFEMAYLYGEITGVLPVNQKIAQEVSVDVNPSDYRMLYHYLGTISDLKDDIKHPLDGNDKIEWEDDTTDLNDSIFQSDPNFDGESGWSRKDVRSASLSNQKRISKCIEGLLQIYNEF